MSECMLCQIRRAEHPYLIGSIGLNVYSVEELLYFMKQNLPLLDGTILNEDLVRWLKDELRMRRLSVNLSMVLQRNFSVREFVMPIFREVHYPDEETIRSVDEELKKMEEKPSDLQMKERGDSLFGYGRYLRAIDVYRAAIEETKKNGGGGDSTEGILWHNIGCAHARLFQLEELVSCMEKSYQLLKTEEARGAWLLAVLLRDGSEGLAKAALSSGIDGSVTRAIEKRAQELPKPDPPADPEKFLVGEVRAYHRNTGM
jgi:hypothetical protein